MNMLRATTTTTLLFMASQLLLSAHAWTSPTTSRLCATRVQVPYSAIVLHSSNDPWSDEEDDEGTTKRTSFDEAGKGLLDEEDTRRMEEMGDFDENPAYSSDNIVKMRDAIRKRTEEMGLEKSVLSKQLIQEANQRAQMGDKDVGLDLTKIRGSVPEDMPTMLYEPEEEMTEEEQREVDPIGYKNILEQAQNELTNAKWPDPGAVLREVAVMFVVVAFTSAVIIFWDKFLRDFYENIGLIPTSQDIDMRFEGLELPEGWTNSMNEEDIANLPSSMRDVGNAASSSGGGGMSLPDL